MNFIFTLSSLFLFVTVFGEDCINIRGRVWCGAKPGADHDGKTVFVQLLDVSGTRGVLDQAYTSKTGRFSVKGCSQRTLTSMTPEVHVLHRCKHNAPRRIKVPLPPNAGMDVNLTTLINLKFDYPEEESFEFDIAEPCDVE